MSEREKINMLKAALREEIAKLREEHKREIEVLEKVLHNLEEREKKSGETSGKSLKPNPRHNNGKMPVPVEAGLWKGMSITDSIHSYLLHCKRGPARFSELLEALKVGGVELGDPEKPNRYAANVKTTVVNNRKRFRYNKRSDMVSLIRPRAVPASSSGRRLEIA